MNRRVGAQASILKEADAAVLTIGVVVAKAAGGG